MSKIYKIDSAGNEVVVESNGTLANIEAITADTTLTVDDSGKTFILDAIGEAITLPAVAAGLQYEFIGSATVATSDWTITAPASVIYGSAEVAGAIVAAAAENTITLVIAKFLAGDRIKLVSDGINWYVSGNVVTALGVTFTDV